MIEFSGGVAPAALWPLTLGVHDLYNNCSLEFEQEILACSERHFFKD